MHSIRRREFIRTGLGALGLGAVGCGGGVPSGPESPSPSPSPTATPATGVPVSIVSAPDYDSSQSALRYACSLIGGLAPLVRGKSVAVKVNITGWGEELLGMPATETYIVHGSVVAALTTALAEAGAANIRLLESVPTMSDLQSFAQDIGWDVAAIVRPGIVRFVNTRNGDNGQYATLQVSNGRLFDSVMVHPAYAECDVLISLAKMKNHRTAGVTLALKNMFGIPPNSLYGVGAPSEDCTGLRYLIHDRRGSREPLLPGERGDMSGEPAGVRVPRAIVDICSVRRIDLAIIDGVSTVSGGEGPWHESTGELQLVHPGVLIVGRDAVATDGVAAAVMGYTDPMSATLPPFTFCENHLRIARDAGLGTGDLDRIDVRGLTIAQVRTPFAWV